jgi:uncharacterized membrane protein YpjA
VVGRLSFLWSRSLWMAPWFLQVLLWGNVLGTIYGYEWYRGQLVETWNESGEWLVIFVPDSPTASLFFSITLLYLLRDARRQARQGGKLVPSTGDRFLSWRGVWEGLAVITQVKYGIWAVAIIFWGASQGDALVWQEWMLVVSHSCMVLEALLYMRFYRFTAVAVAIGAVWTLTNDVVDYTFGVFPYLPRPLYDDLTSVQLFTVSLSALGILCAFLGVAWSKKYRV